MMKQVLLNVTGVGAELAIGKLLQFEKRRGALVHGAKDPRNPNIHGNGIESLVGKKQNAVRHLSPHTGQKAKLLARFGGRLIRQRAEVDFSGCDGVRSAQKAFCPKAQPAFSQFLLRRLSKPRRGGIRIDARARDLLAIDVRAVEGRFAGYGRPASSAR